MFKSQQQKTNIIASTIAVLLGSMLLLACNAKEKEKDIPNALEDRSIDVSLLSKRSGKDLMENLFDELQDRSEVLQQLEQDMQEIGKAKNDSVSLFDRYDNKSHMYYDAASKHAGAIQDSLLRLHIQQIIDSSMLSYKKLIATDTLLIHRIEQNHIALQDLYTILKIVKTMPIMERYQKDYLPADSMLQTLLTRYELLGQKVDSMAGGIR